jgi:hypothetical protein
MAGICLFRKPTWMFPRTAAGEAKCCAEPRFEHVSVWYTFFLLYDSASPRLAIGGTSMDSTALHALIAEVRGTTAALAEAARPYENEAGLFDGRRSAKRASLGSAN